MNNTVSEEHVLEKTTTFKLIKRFNKSREDFKNNERSRRPPTSCDHKNIELMRSHMIFDIWMIVRMIADELDIGKLSMHTVLTYKL